MKKHLPPAYLAGLEDISLQGGGIPTEGASVLLVASRAGRVGSQAESVAMESLERIRLSRAAHMMRKHELGPDPLVRALAFFREDMREANDPLVRVLEKKREFMCEALRALSALHVPPVKGARPPRVTPERVRHALGLMLTLSRFASGAARAKTAALRGFDSTSGYLAKYTAVEVEATSRQKTGRAVAESELALLQEPVHRWRGREENRAANGISRRPSRSDRSEAPRRRKDGVIRQWLH